MVENHADAGVSFLKEYFFPERVYSILYTERSGLGHSEKDIGKFPPSQPFWMVLQSGAGCKNAQNEVSGCKIAMT